MLPDVGRDNDDRVSVGRRGGPPAPLGPSVRGYSGQYISPVAQLNAGRWRVGRAYRAGRLVCGCVHVTVSVDERLGLTERERRMIGVRFHEPVDDELRIELTELARRRGRASLRAAERIAPIEVVIEDPHGQHQRVVGGLRPPQRRHGQLREIVFRLREPE
jgi:hypothetical protein